MSTTSTCTLVLLEPTSIPLETTLQLIASLAQQAIGVPLAPSCQDSALLEPNLRQLATNWPQIALHVQLEKSALSLERPLRERLLRLALCTLLTPNILSIILALLELILIQPLLLILRVVPHAQLALLAKLDLAHQAPFKSSTATPVTIAPLERCTIASIPAPPEPTLCPTRSPQIQGVLIVQMVIIALLGATDLSCAPLAWPVTLKTST
jgi:hypothetical protein